MRQPKIIDVKANPRAIRPGDIIAFNNFPGTTGGQVRGSSGLKTSDFIASDISPQFRGFVLEVAYDPQNNDSPTGFVVMPFAPFKKDRKMVNDEKNLMITSKQQLYTSGLTSERNWRLNYTPVLLPLNSKNFYLDNGRVIKMGYASDDLTSLIMGQVKKLLDMGTFNTMGVLPSNLAGQLKGKQVGDYHKVIGPEAHVAFFGNAKDAKALEQTAEAKAAQEAKAAAEERAARRVEKADAARAMREQMRSSPSGRLAYSLGSRFKEAANPDISIEHALDLDLIDEDTFLVLDELSCDTLRTAYDTLNGEHEKILKDIRYLELADKDSAETYKAGLEVKIKEALTGFYKALQKPISEPPEPIRSHVTAYTPKVIEP